MEPNRKKTQYNYEENSNIVSFADNRRMVKEPTGEGETLKGKSLGKMGEKAVVKKQNLENPKPATKVNNYNNLKENKIINSSINFETYSNLLYKPKTKESADTYKELLKIVLPRNRYPKSHLSHLTN